MTITRIRELLYIERECLIRNINKECDRHCESCNLVQDDIELMEMYDSAIDILNEMLRPNDE